MRPWLLLMILTSCSSGVVGAKCRGDLAECSFRCVDLQSDEGNCGSCGNQCGADEECNAGVCDPDWYDGGRRDASTDARADAIDYDAKPPDADMDDATMVDASTDASGDASCPVCNVGDICCAGSCVNLVSDRNHCGMCGRSCAEDHECVDSDCVPICEAPTTYCSGDCVTLNNDADHCGACNIDCGNGLCIDGTCSDTPPGHVVLIGHSYRYSRVSIRRVLGNAVWLTSRPNLNVAVYEGNSATSARTAVSLAINETAAMRTWNRTLLPSLNNLGSALSMVDVLVVMSQLTADDAMLTAAGASEAGALQSFVERGGVLIVLDGGGAHSGMWQWLSASGLLHAEGRMSIDSLAVSIAAPSDAIASGLPLNYRAETDSVRFVNTTGTAVVTESGEPVVLHRVIVPL